MNRRAVASSLVLASAILLVGCSGGSGTDREATLEQECIEEVAVKAGVDVADVVITERAKNPAGSLDWSGTYPGGQFGCAGAMDADKLFQVITFAN